MNNIVMCSIFYVLEKAHNKIQNEGVMHLMQAL